MLTGDTPADASKSTDARLRALPKPELHVHLDGSLRPATMAALARERGVALPTYDPEALRNHMLVSDAHSLEEYLSRFVLTLSVMQDAPALERIAYELVEDHAEENVRYVEVRFCPALNTAGGLTPDEVMDATLAGLKRAEADFPIRTRVIVCALRTLDPAVSVEMAELAVAYRGRGVVAFDLAGAEAGNPVKDHLDAFRVAESAGLPRTVHAGEGFGAPSIHQAVHMAGAARIGHGTRLFEDPELENLVRERKIPLEVCVTSNVQTGVAPTYGRHPVRRYRAEGIPVVLCTDNRLMSGVAVTDEYAHARDHLGFTWDDLVDVARTGFASAFVDAAARAELLAAFETEAALLG
ncbi:MAG TPA: adenosine deaminase [Longimicrobiales bacterium]|nr:adenosine deaminase [Longimicrobiales bacterium]